MPGNCNARAIQTALSYLVAAVSITTDWIFALLPVFLLWNVQMRTRIKLSVIAMLSLGVFASVAPIVRLRYLLGMNDLSHFLQNLGPILAWAAAEANAGMLVANLPACRPLLELLFATLFSHVSRSSAALRDGSEALEPDRKEWELQEGRSRGKTKATAGMGVETRMYGSELNGDGDDCLSICDDDSQRHMVDESPPTGQQILVKKEFGTKITTTRECIV